MLLQVVTNQLGAFFRFLCRGNDIDMDPTPASQQLRRSGRFRTDNFEGANLACVALQLRDFIVNDSKLSTPTNCTDHSSASFRGPWYPTRNYRAQKISKHIVLTHVLVHVECFHVFETHFPSLMELNQFLVHPERSATWYMRTTKTPLFVHLLRGMWIAIAPKCLSFFWFVMGPWNSSALEIFTVVKTNDWFCCKGGGSKNQAKNKSKGKWMAHTHPSWKPTFHRHNHTKWWLHKSHGLAQCPTKGWSPGKKSSQTLGLGAQLTTAAEFAPSSPRGDIDNTNPSIRTSRKTKYEVLVWARVEVWDLLLHVLRSPFSGPLSIVQNHEPHRAQCDKNRAAARSTVFAKYVKTEQQDQWKTFQLWQFIDAHNVQKSNDTPVCRSKLVKVSQRSAQILYNQLMTYFWGQGFSLTECRKKGNTIFQRCFYSCSSVMRVFGEIVSLFIMFCLVSKSNRKLCSYCWIYKFGGSCDNRKMSKWQQCFPERDFWSIL